MSDALQTLSEVDQLRQRVRSRVHSGAWFPALVLGLFVLVTITLYRTPFRDVNIYNPEAPAWAGLPDMQHSPLASYLYWFLGTPLVLGLIALWYRRRERLTGYRVRWRLFLGVASGALFLLAFLAALPTRQLSTEELTTITVSEPGIGDMVYGFLTPLMVIAVGVVLLGWVERSRWLIFCGFWIGVITWWQFAFGGMGNIPGWLSWLLGGGSGPALGGQVTLLHVHRPGPLLIVIALPLLLFALGRWRRSRTGMSRTGAS
ncbi:hypothetical protein [Catelliglobosispora koreensis]|uniref:hypothetical protein n=1 Tax=Catelliglobosispora koreensis TaxID=129052 RepID=UPI0003709A2B|nr:hypothetical protein [Catelliglobosispora koreensis]